MIINQDILEKKILPQVERPAQYIGGEYNAIVKDWQEQQVKFCFAFPDTYEIAMSHLGLRLIYETINNHSPHICERSFMPADDMVKQLRQNQLPLFSWESRHSLADFDLLGFTLQYELSYTNVLAMLDLAGIPLLAADRGNDDPLVIAGGPCIFNPEPIADFLDICLIGEGEEIILQLLELVKEAKAQGIGKEEILGLATDIPGVYIPSFYTPAYQEDGSFGGLVAKEHAPERIKKRIITEFDLAPFPDKPILPMIKPVHDRIMLEIMRGCSHGCRFCQAGMIYRPIREKSVDVLKAQSNQLVAHSGYDEIALLSLSTADYSDIIPLMDDMLTSYSGCGIGLSLPSLRVDAMSVDLAAKTQEVRKSNMTLAPEAGSQRMRDVINKGVSEDDILDAATAAFCQGYISIKLYFIIGLPYEDKSDLEAIGELCRKILLLGKKHKPVEVKKPLRLNLGVATFVPKPHTPFQWIGQEPLEKLNEKLSFLKEIIRPMKQISLRFHDTRTSMIEAAFARGDRRLGSVLHAAYAKGCHLDGWSEHFDYDAWLAAFTKTGQSAEQIAGRQFVFGEALPWQHIDCGVSPEWLWQEYIRAGRAELTPDCRYGKCNNCGVCDKDWRNIYVETRPAPSVQAKKKNTEPENPVKYRCSVAISYPAIWLSQLDLLAAVEKALRRSGLFIAYSQGFNPHMLISWGPAHPVGLASYNEYFDLTFAKEPPTDWQEQLKQTLPPGIDWGSAKVIETKEKALMASVSHIDYELATIDLDPAAVDQAINDFLDKEEILVSRPGKKGIKTVNIRPAVLSLERKGDSVFYRVRLDVGAVPKPTEMAQILLAGKLMQAYRRAMFINQQGELKQP